MNKASILHSSLIVRKLLGVAISLGFLASISLSQVVVNPHASETIGTVEQVYDGALLPDVQINTFRNIDRLFPTRVVSHGNGKSVYPLPASDRPLPNVHFKSAGKDYDLYDYVSLNHVTGLLVLKKSRIAYEIYQSGNTEKTRWMSMSIAKSITGTLIGAALKDGKIKSIDDHITQYLPQLAGSSYDGVTVRQLLQMISGVKWNESYTDPHSDRRHLLEIQNQQKAGGALALMAQLPRAAPPGTRWNYSTGETQVAGALLRAAVGMSLSEYLAKKIWAKFGMESDATWWLESPNGLEIGGSGLSATLRDYGRFGLFLLADGRAGGESILPDRWVDVAGSPKVVGGKTVDYGYMLWPIPNAEGTIHAKAFEAHGIFGQHLYINPRENLVIVVWAAAPKPSGKAVVKDYDFFAAVAAALH